MSNRRCATVVALALLLGGGAASLAGEERGKGKEEGRPITLRECLTLALANNLDLVSARKDPAIAEQNVIAEHASFDPALTASSQHSDTQREPRSLFDLNQSTSDTAAVGVNQNFTFGGNYSAELSGGRFVQSGSLVTVPTSYGAQIALTFQMPLLRGFGKKAATERLVLARGNLEVSRSDLRVRAEQVMESVEDAYWDVLAARESLRVARLSLERARDLLDLNRKKVQVGTLAPIEITQAEAGVASQEEGVIVAETNLEDAEDELRRLLGVPESDPLWEVRLTPVDEPDFRPVEVNVDEAIRQAIGNRRELSGLRTTIRNRELSERVARRNLRPGLDFTASATPSGNNFTFDPATNQTVINGALSQALQEISDLNNYSWSVGFNFSLPIGNRAAKAGYATAKLNREKAQVDLQNQERTIRVEVRRAVRAVVSGAKRVEAARANVVLQKKNVEAERKKFENGMSTSFEVLTIQDDLADAETKEIQARLDYLKALAALERAKGTLLEARGLTLE